MKLRDRDPCSTSPISTRAADGHPRGPNLQLCQTRTRGRDARHVRKYMGSLFTKAQNRDGGFRPPSATSPRHCCCSRRTIAAFEASPRDWRGRRHQSLARTRMKRLRRRSAYHQLGRRCGGPRQPHHRRPSSAIPVLRPFTRAPQSVPPPVEHTGGSCPSPGIELLKRWTATAPTRCPSDRRHRSCTEMAQVDTSQAAQRTGGSTGETAVLATLARSAGAATCG